MRTTATMLAAACCAAFAVSAQAAGTLVYCSEASPDGFDSAQFTSGTTFDAAGHALFDRLVGFEKGSTKAIPSLATSWSASPDGKVYTFKLRQGVKFHTTDYFKPTRDFNADDVVFTFMRMFDKNHPFRKAYNTEFPYAVDTGLASNVSAVEKVDAQTVRFVLKAPDADLAIKIAMPFASILSAEYAEQLLKAGRAADINQKPVGTGPFIFKRYQKDAQIRYAGNKAYWDKGAVKVDNLVFAIATDPSVRYQKMKAGECQIMSYPRPSDLAVMKTDPKLKMLTAPGFNIGYLSYNMDKPQLQKREVRQALDMAINRQAIIDAVYQGQGQAASNPFPSSLWSYNKSLKNAPYNVAAAKALLAKAGYPNGFELSLWAMPVQRPYNPNAKLMAEMIQSDWAKIGVKAKIVSYEWGEYLKRMKRGEHDAGLMGWTGDYASPDNFLGVLLSCEAVNGSNYSRYCNKEFDSLVVKARTLNDQAERAKLYSQAQTLFKRDLPWTTIAHSIVNQPMRKEVNGFKISPFGDYEFSGVSVK